MTPSDQHFTPEPGFPQNAEFYRRVLHESPAPLIVVDAGAAVIYGNRAVQRMGGWDAAQVGQSVLSHIHPDEVEKLATAFAAVTSAENARGFDEVPWAPIHTRLVTESGQVIPVLVTSAGGLSDPAVSGIVYDIRPAHEQDILRRGLVGLARGEPIDTILRLITDMIALPPLDLDAAVLEPRGDGSYRVIGATNQTLQQILEAAQDPQPWNRGNRYPERSLVSQIPGDVGNDLFAAGYREFWQVAPESNDVADPYRIVACARTINRPSAGEVDRLTRANELASVVLLRARADAQLEHSATHDRLTLLPNRAGFQHRAADALASSDSETAGLLFIDLDGFKKVNDDHGHAAGDQVLQTIANRLVTVLRSIDIVGRFGGDEFVILVGATAGRPVNKDRVQVIADRAIAEFRRAIDIGGVAATVGASIGAVVAPMPVTLAELLAHADAAMYQAKASNGDRHHIIEL